MQIDVIRKALAASRQGHFKRLVLRNNGKSLYAEHDNGQYYLGYVDKQTLDHLEKVSPLVKES